MPKERTLKTKNLNAIILSGNEVHRIASCRMDLAIIKMLVGLCKLMVNKRSSE